MLFPVNYLQSQISLGHKLVKVRINDSLVQHSSYQELKTKTLTKMYFPNRLKDYFLNYINLENQCKSPCLLEVCG